MHNKEELKLFYKIYAHHTSINLETAVFIVIGKMLVKCSSKCTTQYEY